MAPLLGRADLSVLSEAMPSESPWLLVWLVLPIGCKRFLQGQLQALWFCDSPVPAAFIVLGSWVLPACTCQLSSTVPPFAQPGHVPPRTLVGSQGPGEKVGQVGRRRTTIITNDLSVFSPWPRRLAKQGSPNDFFKSWNSLFWSALFQSSFPG